jgi:glycerol kinase
MPAIAKAKKHHAVLEGIAAQVAWLCRAVEADLGSSINRLRVDGGLTRSRVLMQLQADLAQVPIEVFPSTDATALGVASMASLGAGSMGGIARWTPSMVVEPAISADEAEERLMRWRHVAELTGRI